MTDFNKSKHSIIVLITVVLIGLALRWYQLDKNVWLYSGYDETRDMLVASHIVDFHELVRRGPLAAGGLHWLQNSPVYYYFIALIWSFARDPVVFMYLWACILTLPIALGYLAGKKLDNSIATGFLFAVVLAMNPQMIYSSRELLQPHLLILFSAAYIWAMISTLKDKKHAFRYALLSIVFLVVPLHIHYGVLLALPAGSIWIAYAWKKGFHNSQKEFWLKSATLVFIFFSLVLSWILLSYKNYPFDQIYFLILNFSEPGNTSIVNQLSEAVGNIYPMIWVKKASIFSEGLLLATILAILPKVINKKNKRNWGKSQLEIPFFLVSMSLSILFVGFYSHEIDSTYLLYLLPFFLILVALLLRFLIKSYRSFGWLLVIVYLSILLNVNAWLNFVRLPERSYHAQQREIAWRIFRHYEDGERVSEGGALPELLVTSYSTMKNLPYDGWGTSGVWFYLEMFFDQRLVENTDFGMNYHVLQEYPIVVYLVCDHRVFPELIQQECLDRFHLVHPMVDNELELLLAGSNLSLWSGSIPAWKYHKVQNAVYENY